MKAQASGNRAFLIISMLILTALAGAWWMNMRQRPSAPLNSPIYGVIPDFQLTERSGSTISAADLRGHVWIADFIFTRCSSVCPLISSKMRQLQDTLGADPDIRFVSFSVDPQYDKPEVLRAYAEKFKAGNQWLFLTGDKDQIFKLASQHFHLGVVDIPESEREAEDQGVAHSTKLALVDRAGNIRGYYSTEGEAKLDGLIADAKKLLQRG